MGIILIIAVITSLLALGGYILFISYEQKLLESLNASNRQLPPRHVWMQIIPGYGLYFQFVVVNKIADSLKAEMEHRGIRYHEARPGYQLGLIMCIASCASLLPYAGLLAVFGWIGLWIAYWIRLRAYQNIINGGQTKSFTEAEILDDL